MRSHLHALNCVSQKMSNIEFSRNLGVQKTKQKKKEKEIERKKKTNTIDSTNYLGKRVIIFPPWVQVTVSRDIPSELFSLSSKIVSNVLGEYHASFKLKTFFCRHKEVSAL